MGTASLHYSATPVSKVPGGLLAQSEPVMQSQPFSPPYQQSKPVTTSTPYSGPQHHFPVGEGGKKDVMKEFPVDFKRYDAVPRAGNMSDHPSDHNFGYPVNNSSSFQRKQSSSSTSSQPWDPNDSMRSSHQNLDLSASSSSVKSNPIAAHSPRKWGSQDSAESSEGYVSCYGQMSPDYKIPHPGSGTGIQYQQTARSPPHGAGSYHHFQGPHQQQERVVAAGRGGFSQQFAGSPQQGYYNIIVPPNPNERTKPSSGPIPSELAREDQSGGLWMGEHRQSNKKPNSAELLKIKQHPGRGECFNHACAPIIHRKNASIFILRTR